MNLRRIRYFVAVAEELHFGRAADRLAIAQPPLSQQIRLLEEELGLRLFDRSTRRVSLTEAGRLLLSEARRLLSDVGALERRMDQVRTGEGGVLRLGFVDSASYSVMPTFLRAFRSRYPAVTHELRTMSSDEQFAALGSGEIDLGLVRAPTTDDSMDVTPFLSERLVVAVGPDHELASQQSTSISRAGGFALVGFDRRVSPTLHGVMARLFDECGARYDPVIEATEYTTVLGLVASGQGIAVVPASVETFRPPGLSYLRLNDREATTTLSVAHRRDHLSLLVARAVESVVETFS